MGKRNYWRKQPPVQYTYNGKGFSARGGLSNLKPEHYGDFAGYMADVAARYTGEGYHISHISPVNEPQYNWDSGQEGSGLRFFVGRGCEVHTSWWRLRQRR